MKVTILRGISGSGKSTWIKNHAPEALVVSADHEFIKPDGTVDYDPARIEIAHRKCFKAFLKALHDKAPHIVVDNTNIALWEISPYIRMAQTAGYVFEILTLLVDPEIAIKRKDWVPAPKVRRKAKLLSDETRQMPPFMRDAHRIIDTNG